MTYAEAMKLAHICSERLNNGRHVADVDIRVLCDHILSGDMRREIENAAFERLELIGLRRRDEWAKSGSERLLEGRRDGAVICGARAEEAGYLAQQARALIQPPAQQKENGE